MHITAIEALLTRATGSQVDVSTQVNDAFHPESFSFYNSDPSYAKRLSAKPIFEHTITFKEEGEYEEHRIERKDGILFYMKLDRDPDVCNVEGQGLICEPGSDAESVFLLNANAAIAESAAQLLVAMMDDLRAAKLTLSPAYAAKLSKDIFGDTAGS